MKEFRWFCFPLKPQDGEDTDNDISDDEYNDEGYERLNGNDNKDIRDENFLPKDDRVKEQPFSKKDKKAKKLSRKLRRKEKKRHFIHVLRVSLKWCKKGLLATVPHLGASFNLAPSPAPIFNIQKASRKL